MPCRGVRAFLVNPPCHDGTWELLLLLELVLEDLSEEAVFKRTLLCLRANWLAECTEESHAWQRKASSAAQYHRALFFMQLSQALAVFAPTTLAAAAEADAAAFLFEIIEQNKRKRVTKSRSRSKSNRVYRKLGSARCLLEYSVYVYK